jgi:hypothetical protein
MATEEGRKGSAGFVALPAAADDPLRGDDFTVGPRGAGVHDPDQLPPVAAGDSGRKASNPKEKAP